MDQKEILILERYLSEFDLSEWEKDTLIEFNKIKPIDELTEYVKKELEHEFLINLADGIHQLKHKIIEEKTEKIFQ